MVDILSIEPHKVSTDLRGYSIFIYGAPKSGKTTVASMFPKSLLLAFEKGYSALPGVKVQPLNTWYEARSVFRQLKRNEAKEMYETIIIDTMDLAYICTEDFVCQKHDIENIKDLGYGAGYAEIARELTTVLNDIVRDDYSLVLISHAQDKVFKDENEKEFQKIVPTLPSTAWKVVQRLCDIIGYVRTVKNPETGEEQTLFYQRGSIRFEAGSRFKYSSAYIPFTYEALTHDIQQAIWKVGEETGMLKDEKDIPHESVKPDYDKVMQEFNQLAEKAVEVLGKEEAVRCVENIIGQGKKVSQIPRENSELINEINESLKFRMEQSQ